MLQTEAYAHTLIEADNPGVSGEEINRRVHVRLARQTLLTRATAAPQLRIVLNEAIVKRPIGGTTVMSQQLKRLLEVGELPNISLRMMPFDVGLHPGVMSGPFVILRFPPMAMAGRLNHQPSTLTASLERSISTSELRLTATTKPSRASGMVL